MTVYKIDPVQDPRWQDLLQRNPDASVFHTPGWLEALRRAYGYEPIAFTTCRPRDELTNGLVFCVVNSWLTGRRLVSLPFSDHCEFLVERREDMEEIVEVVRRDAEEQRLDYVEVRPVRFRPLRAESGIGFRAGRTYWFHVLDLSPSLEELRRNLHKGSVRRKIRRAEREGLIYEKGRSVALLDKFYFLFLRTRLRFGLPPPPRSWFNFLIACLGRAANIHVASKEGRPVAAIFTLRHRNCLVYKYGASERADNKSGGMPFLFWKAMEEGKAEGAEALDLGRSDRDNLGLVAFKDHLGASRSELSYWLLERRPSQAMNGRWESAVAKQVAGRLPTGLLAAAGRLFYRHLG